MTYKSSFHMVCCLILTLSMAACTYNPFSSNNHLTGDVASPVVGGIIGGGTAAALGVSSKPLIGLAALGGASIGYYISSRRFASAGVMQAGGQVYSLGDYLTIEIPSDSLFDTNTADLLPEAKPVLNSAINVLSRFPCQNIMISGNTSGFSTTRFERKLSEDRARAVSSYLWANGVNNFKFPSNNTRKLTYVGYGNYYPISNNITNSGVRSNSRIQITAYPTIDQLGISKKAGAFNNMGGLDDSTPLEKSPHDYDQGFTAGTSLSQESAAIPSSSADFKETDTVTVASASDYTKEKYYVSVDYKGER